MRILQEANSLLVALDMGQTNGGQKLAAEAKKG